MNSEHFKLVRIVVLCVALICVVCAAGGIFLSFKGYTEAQMLIQVASAGVGGLLGLISLRNPSQPEKPSGEMSAQQVQPILTKP